MMPALSAKPWFVPPREIDRGETPLSSTPSPHAARETVKTAQAATATAHLRPIAGNPLPERKTNEISQTYPFDSAARPAQVLRSRENDFTNSNLHAGHAG